MELTLLGRADTLRVQNSFCSQLNTRFRELFPDLTTSPRAPLAPVAVVLIIGAALRGLQAPPILPTRPRQALRRGLLHCL